MILVSKLQEIKRRKMNIVFPHYVHQHEVSCLLAIFQVLAAFNVKWISINTIKKYFITSKLYLK